jgi:hypothetical protein
MRIAVEQSFGMLVARWKILRAPLPFLTPRKQRIIKVAFMMHNFCQRHNDGAPLMEARPDELRNRNEAYFSRELGEFRTEVGWCEGNQWGRTVVTIDGIARRRGIVGQLELHNIRRPRSARSGNETALT